MTILVNRYTASASEITAGALQDNGIGVLVGEKTYGKGVMQSLTQLPDGAAIKITTAHYLTPKHRDINLKGIEPDFAVTENKNARFGDATNDAQLQAAISILTKKDRRPVTLRPVRACLRPRHPWLAANHARERATRRNCFEPDCGRLAQLVERLLYM